MIVTTRYYFSAIFHILETTSVRKMLGRNKDLSQWERFMSQAIAEKITAEYDRQAASKNSNIILGWLRGKLLRSKG